MPDNIKAICFVLRNVRSTGEGGQTSVNRQKKKGTTAAAAERQLKPAAERETRESGHKETQRNCKGRRRRRRRKNGV